MCSDGMPVLKIRQLIKNGLIFSLSFFLPAETAEKILWICHRWCPLMLDILWVVHVPAGWHEAPMLAEANSELSLNRDYICLLIFLTMFLLHFKELLCHFFILPRSLIDSGEFRSRNRFCKKPLRDEGFFFSTVCSTQWTVTQPSVLK